MTLQKKHVMWYLAYWVFTAGRHSVLSVCLYHIRAAWFFHAEKKILVSVLDAFHSVFTFDLFEKIMHENERREERRWRIKPLSNYSLIKHFLHAFLLHPVGLLSFLCNIDWTKKNNFTNLLLKKNCKERCTAAHVNSLSFLLSAAFMK